MKKALWKASAVAGFALLLTAGIASAQTSPSLMVGFTSAPSVPTGSNQVTLATIAFNAISAGQNVTIQSIPITAQFNTVVSSVLSNCSIQNVYALGIPVSLPIADSALVSGSATFTFGSPIVVPNGTVAHYSLVCDVSPLVESGTIVLGVNPSAIQTSIATGTLNVTPSGNLAGSISVTSGSSQSVPPTSTGGSPGVPNTGVGGDFLATLLILSISLLAAYVGAVVTRRLGKKAY